MQLIVRPTRGRRFVAQAMALVFALVTVWSSLAHACHGAHHNDAQQIVAQVGGDTETTSAAHADQGDHAPASSHVPQKSGHPCCADLQCHGGIAIVAMGVAAAWPLPDGEKFLIYDQTREGWFLSSLDRPPRATVQI